MVKHAARRVLFVSGLGFAAACGPDGASTSASVTIDVRCGSAADCPSGFECTADVEHGPPISLCESADPAATCPAGYHTEVLFSQTFCKPKAALTSRVGRTGDGGRRRRGGR